MNKIQVLRSVTCSYFTTKKIINQINEVKKMKTHELTIKPDLAVAKIVGIKPFEIR